MRSFICDRCQLPTKAELAAEWTDGTKELGKTCQPCHEAKGKRSSLPEHPEWVERAVEKVAKFAEQYGAYATGRPRISETARDRGVTAVVQPDEYAVVVKNDWDSALGGWCGEPVDKEEVQRQLQAYSRGCLVAASGLTTANTITLSTGGKATLTSSASSFPDFDKFVQERVRKHEEALVKAIAAKGFTVKFEKGIHDEVVCLIERVKPEYSIEDSMGRGNECVGKFDPPLTFKPLS